MDLEVVLYKGMIREKPTSKEEAWNFIKGWLIVFFSSTAVDKTPTGSVVIWLLFAGYSGGHAAVIGSVLVSNLTTGTRKGAWETAEVLSVAVVVDVYILVDWDN